MDRRIVGSVILVALGTALIVFNRQLTNMYIASYKRLAKWLLGPVSLSRPHLPWIIGGVALILAGLAEFLGWIH